MRKSRLKPGGHGVERADAHFKIAIRLLAATLNEGPPQPAPARIQEAAQAIGGHPNDAKRHEKSEILHKASRSILPAIQRSREVGCSIWLVLAGMPGREIGRPWNGRVRLWAASQGPRWRGQRTQLVQRAIDVPCDEAVRNAAVFHAEDKGQSEVQILSAALYTEEAARVQA